MSLGGRLRGVAALGLLGLLVACAVPPHRAPVEDRSTGSAGKSAASTPASSTTGAVPAVDPKLLPGAENAGKPGYYTVKQGDTLIRIALDNGQNWRDLVKWNNLPNANLIEVGQVLRVMAPGANPVVSTKPVNTAKVETRPLDGKPPAVATAASVGGSAPSSAAASSAPASAPASAASSSVPAAGVPAARGSEDEVAWAWPVPGAVIQSFDDSRNKGVDLGGKAGDAVLAAASGRVMYVGSSLRGYGNAIIVKHANDYLSVYAHNQTMLVKEDQLVHRGQKIAEMGSSDADQVKLHFEVRKSGKPLDPAKVLPPR
ncbi:peptidoglycan DD-metalloendopeptidase family protein [Mitsuaria sp. WAJ17]|uniref:peptidoglycan DD-metalloendopeptidase family protein n=1 Tax=Mitsuaria sp. WAJ17 TaxID=2761452 RepID=UPI001601764B|nr:peptidoglycan DD-metalloendopeptidase family protein [Mitsuaria sp. WAJ17]MBB2485576.1 peptidoglycan DD-metalloendopeptidase family protein [Mitsuaria sp. WAJ17]